MLDALTLDQMRAFVAVAEAGSFRGAALRLSRVQSAVSHAVANLEGQLGLVLLDRSGHRPVLTRDGSALLADMRAILLKVDCLKARAQGLGEGVEMDIALAVDCLFPAAMAGSALADLHEAYPPVGVRMSVVPLGAPVLAVLERRATLALVAGENFRTSEMVFEPLGAIHMMAVAAPGHPLAAHSAEGCPEITSELTDHLQIVIADPTPLSEGRDFGVLSPGTWRVDSQDAKLALIRSGLGWGRLPCWLIEEDLAAGRLVRLRGKAIEPSAGHRIETYLVGRLDTPLGPAARVLRDSLLRQTREG